MKTEYAGNPKGHIQSKTESETVYGNGAERQKRTYMTFIWREPKCDLCFYSYMASDFTLLVTSMENQKEWVIDR